MAFFDQLANMFGFGPGPDKFQANAPTVASEDYLQGLNQASSAASNRPDTSSYADQLLAAQVQNSQKQQMALAASAKGQVNPALLQRNMLRNQAEQAGQAAQSAGLIRAQEALQNRALNDQTALAYNQMGLQGRMANANANMQAQGINAGVAAQNAQVQSTRQGGLMNALGGLGGMMLQGGQKKMSQGGNVPGKAKVPGDHEANDTVPAMLSPGEIVVPRSHAGSAEKAKSFIDALKGNSSKFHSNDSYSKVLAANQKLKKKISELESKMKKGSSK